MNFNTFVNTCRVDEVKKFLIECPERIVLAIAYESGFNSKFSFYYYFPDFSELTPIKYHKNSSYSKFQNFFKKMSG